MRVLVDTDVILDFLLERPAFIEAAQAIWEANSRGYFEGNISAVTPVNVFYFARKFKGAETARQVVGELLTVWRVCAVDASVLKAAPALPLADYEDAVQHESATARKPDALVTRNLDDYRHATLEVLTPADFLARLAANS